MKKDQARAAGLPQGPMDRVLQRSSAFYGTATNRERRLIMRRINVLWLLLAGLLPGAARAGEAEVGRLPLAAFRLPVKEYRDKMKAGWIGQMVGVSWGGPIDCP